MKIKVWAEVKEEQEIDLKWLGMSDQEWESMDEEERYDYIFLFVDNHLRFGYEELE